MVLKVMHVLLMLIHERRRIVELHLQIHNLGNQIIISSNKLLKELG